MTILIIITSVLSILTFVLIYFIYKLNLYISKLEAEIIKTKDVCENLKQTFRDVLVYDYFLLDNGKLMKTNLQKEKNVIINGMQLSEEQDVEF